MHDEKRNSGHTGPTTPEGRAICSRNAIKHGACSKTLILPSESEQDWLDLFDRWCSEYKPKAGLELDFVLKVAQAEWYRLRTQRYYDRYLQSLGDIPPFDWTPDEIKKHDLCLRYKTAAERAFQRDYRLLEQHLKAHPIAIPEGLSHNDEPFHQHIKVSIVEGKPRIYSSPDRISIMQWTWSPLNRGKLIQNYSFPDGVPEQFWPMFPNPADRIAGATCERQMSGHDWNTAYKKRKLYPKGIRVEYEPALKQQ